MPLLNGLDILIRSVYGEKKWLKLKVCQFFSLQTVQLELYFSAANSCKLELGNMISDTKCIFIFWTFFLVPIFVLCIKKQRSAVRDAFSILM